MAKRFGFLAMGLLFLATTHAQMNKAALSVIISSSFKMVLSPTKNNLVASVIRKLDSAIKTTLLLSASSLDNFSSLFEVDVVLQQVDWVMNQGPSQLGNVNEPYSSLEFSVIATFYNDANGDLNSSEVPSARDLDSLILQTFWQNNSYEGR